MKGELVNESCDMCGCNLCEGETLTVMEGGVGCSDCTRQMKGRKVLVDHTHPEGDMYEWSFEIRTMTSAHENSYDGPAGMQYKSWPYEMKFVEHGIIFDVKLDEVKCHNLFHRLPLEERLSIMEYCTGTNDPKYHDHIEYDAMMHAVIRTILNDTGCDCVWHLAE